MEDESPLVKLAYAILLSAEKQRATEVRIGRDGPRSVVDFVIDGNVVEEMTPPPHLHSFLVRRMSVMAALPTYGKDQWAEGFILLEVADRRLSFALRVEGHGDAAEATLRRISDAELAQRGD